MPSSSGDHRRDRRDRDRDRHNDEITAHKRKEDDVNEDDADPEALILSEEKKEDRYSRRGDRKRRDESSSRRQHKKRKDDDHDDDDDDSVESSSSAEEDRKRKRRKKKSSRSKSSSRKSKKLRRGKSRHSKKHRKRSSSPSDSDSSSDDDDDDSSSSSSSDEQGNDRSAKKAKLINEKLLVKLQARGETLDERKERRAQKRAAKIQARFGYTAEENPFNDPNLHETFTWSKKKEKAPASSKSDHPDTLLEIDTIRRRRKERDAERDEMERLRAEESRMKELENYDDWARKEEEFHLEQQRKRSAIRLVEGREKPIDVLAKNLLLFGLTDEEKNHRAAVKYKERYNALEQLDKLEAELEEPHKIVQVLKLAELQELLVDIDAFRMLEREGMTEGVSKNSILLYWDALQVVARDEVKFLQNGGDDSPYAKKVTSIKEIFAGQSKPALLKMGEEIDAKLAKRDDAVMDNKVYWRQVKEQLIVHLAKMDLSELHSKMLVRQLERLEQRKDELARQKEERKDEPEEEGGASMVPQNVDADFGNREDELGETDEVALESTKKYSWQDRYAPRKPRYFNRVKTGYDWNKYNQTHYDHDNPPPKTVQGYKFNIFYPDLVDPTKTPQFFIEAAGSNDFCILRFHAGPPYEDVAFKIINREWNRSRKRGFKCTFERGVLSLYFNFATHWYRR